MICTHYASFAFCFVYSCQCEGWASHSSVTFWQEIALGGLLFFEKMLWHNPLISLFATKLSSSFSGHLDWGCRRLAVGLRFSRNVGADQWNDDLQDRPFCNANTFWILITFWILKFYEIKFFKNFNKIHFFTNFNEIKFFKFLLYQTFINFNLI